MRSEERYNYLIRAAQENGYVSIISAAEKLGVSDETVRRDIKLLCQQNQLRKVRGGASPVKLHFRRDTNYESRLRSHQRERISIGREAASLIRSGSVIALDCGISIQAVASCVSGVSDVTFVTNSLPTAFILMEKVSSGEIGGRIILIGGELDPSNKFSKGASVVDQIDKYYFDLAFISCTAVSENGVSSYSTDEATFSSHLIKRSSSSVLIAESDKMGKNSFCGFAKLGDFDKLIADNKTPIPADLKKELDALGKELIIVDCSESGNEI